MNAYVTGAITRMIKENAALSTVATHRQADGTFCRLTYNRFNGRHFVLENQLVRDAKTGRFVKLATAMESM